MTKRRYATKGKLRAQFIVSIRIPPSATRGDVRRYIEDALRQWHRALDPGDDKRDGDPMFNLDADDVIVKEKWQWTKSR
jgi:hypothetical protein